MAEQSERRKRTLLRRHKALTGLAALLLVLAIAAGGAIWYVNSKLGSIDRFTSALTPEDRVTKPTTGRAAEALNILVLGTDKGNGETIESELSDGEWTPGAFRSDTIMLVHIPQDRSTAYVISIPRDSYVDIPHNRTQKVNAAFSFGGPDLAVQTIERLTGVYVDHVTMVDWDGFKDLTEVVGGVKVTIPETFTDPQNDRTWEAGTYNLAGREALNYVRTRYGLENGDFDRIKRQQNFLRATMRKAMSQGTLTNPLKLRGLLDAIADNATVDSKFSTTKMRALARDLRSVGSGDVVFLTAPTDGLDDVEGVGSVVLLDPTEGKALWEAVADDNVESYLDAYSEDRLGDPGGVQ